MQTMRTNVICELVRVEVLFIVVQDNSFGLGISRAYLKNVSRIAKLNEMIAHMQGESACFVTNLKRIQVLFLLIQQYP